MFLGMTFLVASAMFLQNCKNGVKKGCGETKISKSGEKESHNNGKNCMTCHVESGDGDGCFVVAGSAYKSDKSSPASSGSIKLYTEANGGGTLKHTIQIDQNGNFYTTENIDMTGLFPSIDLGGNVQHMSTQPGTGACNSCHGVTTEKLWGTN